MTASYKTKSFHLLGHKKNLVEQRIKGAFTARALIKDYPAILKYGVQVQLPTWQTYGEGVNREAGISSGGGSSIGIKVLSGALSIQVAGPDEDKG